MEDQLHVSDYEPIRKSILNSFGVTEEQLQEHDELEKSKGEGSKGGKVIGHTKSGKPIYERKSGSHEVYKDYDESDHEDAAEEHKKLRKKYTNEIPDHVFKRKGSGWTKHPLESKRDYHTQRQYEHESEAFKIRKQNK